jgi:hypothetical protein
MYHHSRCSSYVDWLFVVAVGLWLPVIGYQNLTGDVPLWLRWTTSGVWGLLALLSIVVPGIILIPERYWWAKACSASVFFVVLGYVLHQTEMSFLSALIASIMAEGVVAIAFQLALERFDDWRRRRQTLRGPFEERACR